ncbi:unnamed protein product [Arctogadus glacialis]
MEEIAASVVMTEHDFGSAPKSGALDAAAARIQQLEETVKELTRAVAAESLQEKVLADMFQCCDFCVKSPHRLHL